MNSQLTDFEESNTVDTYRSVMRVRQMLHAASTAVAKKFDMSVSEMALLDTLGKYGPLTMGRLAELFQFSCQCHLHRAWPGETWPC